MKRTESGKKRTESVSSTEPLSRCGSEKKRTESVSGAFERFERFEKMNRAGSKKENRMSTSSISDIGDGKLVPQRNIEEKENEKKQTKTEKNIDG